MSKRDLALAGDLLFYRINRSTGWVGKAIGFLQKLVGQEGTKPGAQYYHVAILDESLDYQYEATFPKTRKSAVKWDHPDLEVWRIMSAPEENLKRMIESSSLHLGEWYGIGRSIYCMLRRHRLQVCTEYVIKHARRADIILYPRRSELIVTPDELNENPLICPV